MALFKSVTVKLNLSELFADSMMLNNEEIGAAVVITAWLARRGGARLGDDQTLRAVARVSAHRWRTKLWPAISHLFWIEDDYVYINHSWLEGPRRGPLAAALRDAVLERDSYTCVYCGTADGPFEIDHIHPVVKGGTDDIENLACACRRCNRSKGSKLLSEWVR